MNNLYMNDTSLEEVYLKYGFALNMLETEIDILLKNYVYEHKYNPVEHVKSRLKTEESVIKKLEKKGYEINCENIIKHVHDVIGIRIVCSFISDVYEIVDLIKKSNQFEIKEEKDYIKNPKSTGYISYHLIVVVPIHLKNKVEYVDAEIQIRTMAMDFWASLDHKLQYKVREKISKDMQEEIYNCSLDIKKLDSKMNELNKKVNKYKEGELFEDYSK